MQQHSFQSVFDAISDTPAEAANLTMRAEIMRHIANTVAQNQWTQSQAAKHCGISQPRMNDLLNGKIDKFSLDALVNINAQLGHSIDLIFNDDMAQPVEALP
ncbi:helix-turn-helix domain-containing protein [Suttonella ornithocola]|uniref:Uncharacterized conserved small protein n=1 Tax=Suttonella ornithocola TaxID=279832 RepID=A0A380MLV2_9GAMM|nr:XRE family transcriptional regulator [Suttonella ornithocola]SUO93036.1 Uncharacterized conserved small protein [Suttonella ornithocola]